MTKHPILLFLLLSFGAYANPADSLENALKTAKGDLKVKTLNELFRAYINSDPVKAIGYTREALTLATEIEDKKGMAASYNNLGVAYRSQGALDKSLEYYLIAMRIYDNLKNQDGIATIKSNIATIYSMKKDYGQAMKYFEESYNHFSQLKDQPKIIVAMNNLGSLHSELQLYEQALKYFTQASQLSESMGKLYSDPLNNIGNLYYKQGNYKQAIEYYQRALALAKKENNQMTVLNIMANMGEVFARQGQSSKAEHYLDSAAKLSKQLQAFVFEPAILKSLAFNYSKQGKMREAYETFVLYDQAKEKLNSDESTRKIAQMEMVLDLQEKEKEVERLKSQEEMTSLQLKNTRMIITLIILVLVAGFAVVNIYITKRKGTRS